MMTPSELVRNEIYTNQTTLVEKMIQDNVFSFEDIENLWDESGEPHEIFSWYTCSEWLIDKMRDMGYPVINNEFGCWYGRTTFGQLIEMDYEIRQICGEED